ncbi:MAG: response regulator transcription factor [Methylovirgula sp.]
MQKLPSTIIIVDDDIQVLRSLCFLLEAEGYFVRTFNSAAALLEEETLPDNACLVVDYRMPTMNGLDLLARVREKFPQVPALLITGYPDDTIEKRAADIGIKVVRKPHLDDALLDSIRDVFAPI